MAQRRRKPQQRRTSSAIPIVALSVLLTAAAFFLRLPGIAVLLVGVLVAAWMEPQPELTGSKGTPANPAEEAKLARYNFWSDLRLGIFSPSVLSPGWPVRASFIVAVLSAIAAFGLPVFDGWSRLADAVCAYLLVSLVTEVRRRSANVEGDHPAVRVDTLSKVRPTHFSVGAAALAIAFVVLLSAKGILSGFAGHKPHHHKAFLANAQNWLTWRPELNSPAFWLTISAGALLAGLAGIAKPWCDAALAKWRTIVDARATWNPRWTQLKLDPPPHIVDVRSVEHPSGVMAEDIEFRCPGHQGFVDFEGLAPKLHPMTGAGTSVSVLPVAEIGPDGQPIAGTVDPTKFRVAIFPTPVPDVDAPGTSEDWAKLFLEAAVRQTAGKVVGVRPVLSELQGHQVEGSGRMIWLTRWTWLDDFSLQALARESQALSTTAKTRAQVDAAETDAIYFGALDEAPTDLAGLLRRRRIDDEWAARWLNVKLVQKQNPKFDHPTYQELALPGRGGKLCTVGFMTRKGQDPRQFRTATLENQLRPAMGAALTFLSVTSWHAPAKGFGSREGDRHHGAFRLSWSTDAVADTPSTLRKSPAAQYVLAGMVNKAFDAAKMSRAEVTATRPLSVDDVYGQLWEISLRLYDGVTADQVRGQIERMRTAMGAEWIRVEDTDDGCKLYAGDAPASVELINPRADEAHLISLDWEQAWRSSGVKGVGGALPKLMGPVSTMPKNTNIKILDYKLPDGVEIGEVREKKVRTKLGNMTGNGWVMVRPHPDEVGAIRVLCAEKDPMPSKVPYDYGANFSTTHVPFATGEDGEAIPLNLSDSPHLLVLGLSGSGKSAFAANLVYGFISGGCEVVAVDPTKGAADFAFADDWLLARAGKDPGQSQLDAERVAAATMQAVYAEGKRRIEAYTAEGKVKASDMANPPKPIVVFFDEFAGVLEIEKMSAIGRQPLDDPEMEADRLERLESRELKLKMLKVVANIAAELRSAGIHLVLLTQRLTAKLLEDMPKGQTLRTNMARLILGKASYSDKASALREPDLAPEHGERIPKGRGIFEPLDAPSMLMQGWFDVPDGFAEKLRESVPTKSESERLDITPFLNKPENDAGQVGVAVPVGRARPIQDEKVELDAMDIDDSFWDDDDDDLVSADSVNGPGSPEAELDAMLSEPGPTSDAGSDVDATPIEPEPAPEITPGEGPRTLVMLDVDGTLLPEGPRESWASWPDWQETDVGFGKPAPVSQTMLDRLDDVRGTDAGLAWLTDWNHKANSVFAPLLGYGVDLPVMTDQGTGSTGWWKFDALLNYVQTHPETRRVCWIDDRLSDEDEGGSADPKKVAVVLDRLGVEHLLITVDPSAGLTPEQMTAIEDWVAERQPALKGAEEDEEGEEEEELVTTPVGPETGTVLIAEVDGAMRGAFSSEPDPELIQTITQLEASGAARFVWMTDWGESVNVSFGRLLGDTDHEVITDPGGDESAYGLWKLDALERWLEGAAEVNRIIWADPAAWVTNEMGFGTNGEAAAKIARDHGVELVLAELSGGELDPGEVRRAAQTARI